MENNIDAKNIQRIEKMKKIGVAGVVALVGLGVPAMMTPSAMAFDDAMHSLTTMDLAYTQTATGYSVNVNAKDLSMIGSSGINLEAYINEEFYIMVDEVIVDMDALYSQHGTTSFNINIDKTADGFNYYLTTEVGGSQVSIEMATGSSFIGQVTRDYMGTTQDSKLYTGNGEVQQMNYDGDLFVVFENQGEYSTTPTMSNTNEDTDIIEVEQEVEVEVEEVEDKVIDDGGDIITVIPTDTEEEPDTQVAVDTPDVDDTTDTIVLYNPPSEEYGTGGSNLAQGREDDIIEVDSTEVLNIMNEGKTSADLTAQDYARKEKQNNLSKKQESVNKVASLDGALKDASKNMLVQKAPTFNKSEVKAETSAFNDIQGVFSEQAINNLVDKGVIEKQSSMFKPHESVSREQFAIMVANAVQVKGADHTVFKDMQGSPYAGKIQALQEAGIFLGDNGEFKPHDTLSRQQASAVLVRTLEYKGYDTSALAKAPKFEDSSSIAVYAKESVAILQDLGVVDGQKNGNFDPYGQLTNAQIAKMLNSVVGIIEA